MKKFILTCLAFVFILQAEAQENFGKAIFVTPAGWSVTKSKESVTMEKPGAKGSVCKIIVSATEKLAVTTNAEYLKYRSSKNTSGVSYSNARGAVTKYEAGALVGFYSKGTFSQKMKPVYSFFYTMCNGTSTVYFQLITDNQECIADFTQFLDSLEMEAEEDSNAPAARKKTLPNGGAAPAPVM